MRERERERERERARGRNFLLQVFIHRAGEGPKNTKEKKVGVLYVCRAERICKSALTSASERTNSSAFAQAFWRRPRRCCCCAGAIDMANAPPSFFASSLPARRLPRTFCATVSPPSQRPPPQRRASLGMVCVCTAAPFLVT